MNIPTEAVEAAAEALLQITYPHDADWGGWDEPGHVRLRMEALEILEAAAPYMQTTTSQENAMTVEQLEQDIRDIPVTVISGPPVDLTGVLAKHLHDLGYRKPQQVTSRAHLKDLEDPDTILTDYLGNAYQWGIGLDGSEGWQSTRDPNPITSGHLLRFAPLAVLRVGTTK